MKFLLFGFTAFIIKSSLTERRGLKFVQPTAITYIPTSSLTERRGLKSLAAYIKGPRKDVVSHRETWIEITVEPRMLYSED